MSRPKLRVVREGDEHRIVEDVPTKHLGPINPKVSKQSQEVVDNLWKARLDLDREYSEDKKTIWFVVLTILAVFLVSILASVI